MVLVIKTAETFMVQYTIGYKGYVYFIYYSEIYIIYNDIQCVEHVEYLFIKQNDIALNMDV